MILVDLHCHIIPGFDDGPPDRSEFIKMANLAVSSGINHIFATPHHWNGVYDNSKEKILQAVLHYNNVLQQNGIPLVLHPGQELRIHREIYNSFENDEILTLDNNQYLLLELPPYEIPSYTFEVVYELLLRGVNPIIAHPERNRELHKRPDFLYELVREGALVQLTAGSILGIFGKKVKIYSERLINKRLAHFIASDAHNITNRSFLLQESYDLISKLFGNELTFFFMENAALLLDGKSPQRSEPLPFKKNLFGIFR